MAHNYEKGIDYVGDPTGATPLAGYFFVGKQGNDANPGTDPSLPKLTIQSALTVASDNDNIVLGEGLYNEFDLTSVGSNKGLIGDGLVTLLREGNKLFDDGLSIRFDGVDIFGYDDFDLDIISFNDCNVNVIAFTINAPLTDPMPWTNTVFKDSVITLSDELSVPTASPINFCIFDDVEFTQGSKSITSIKNSHFSASSNWSMADVADSNRVTWCNINTGITMNNIPYVDLLSAQVVGGFNNCIDVAANFTAPDLIDYTLQSTSELFGRGESGVNITGQRLGYAFGATSTEVASGSGDVAFVGGEWTSAGAEALWTTNTIDLFKIRKIGPINIQGFVDFINNVPDYDNASVNVNFPNNLDLQLRWADNEADLVLATYQNFRWNKQPTFDGLVYNGDSGFDWASQLSLSGRYIQVKVAIRNDYVAA